jgi:hypothetical protein
MATKNIQIVVPNKFSPEQAQNIFNKALANMEYRKGYQSKRNSELKELKRKLASGELKLVDSPASK